MAIFGKERAQQASRNGATIIAAGTQLVGNLSLTDNLHVDGRIDGDTESSASVVIGADGHVKGRIKAETVVVSGRVDGSVNASRLEIIAGGSVEGDVHVTDLVIEPGGRFNGSSEIVGDDARALKAVPKPGASGAAPRNKSDTDTESGSTTGTHGA